MHKYDAIIFDLDGTLWDTCSVCADVWNNVLETSGIPFRQITASDIRRVTGKPHEDCIRETFAGLSEEKIQTLIDRTNKEENKVVAERGGHIYPGVEQKLRILSERHKLFIVSNCQAGYIETFLKISGYERFFVDFESWGNTGQSKAANIQSVISRNSLINPVYVGDTEGDRSAARACGIPFVFASYGFGECHDFDYQISSFAELF